MLRSQRGTGLGWLFPWLQRAVPFIALFFVLFVVAPRRGIHLSGDEGFFLITALGTARGQGADLIMPQSAHYLFNALLFEAGATDLWVFKYAFIIGVAVAAAVLFYQLGGRFQKAGLVPLSIAPALLINLNQIYNHYTVSLSALSIGIALVIASERRNDKLGRWLAPVAGTVLGVATIFNAAIGLAIAIGMAILCSVGRPREVRILGIAFVAAFVSAWTIYVTWLGLDHLLATPAHSPSSIVDKGWSIVSFYSYAVASLLVCIGGAQLLLRNWSLAIFAGVAVMTSAAFVWLFVVEVQIILGVTTCVARPSFFFYLFWLDFCHQSKLGVFAYWALTANVTGLFLYRKLRLSSRMVGVDTAGSAIGWKQRLRSVLALSPPSFRTHSGALMLTGAFFCLVAAAGALGSNSHFGVGMSWSAGLAIGLSGLIASSMARNLWQKRWAAINVVIGLVASITFALTINHSSGKPLFSSEDVYVTQGPLRGNYISPADAEFLEKFKAAFDSNNCQTSDFIIIDSMPLLYIVANKLPPDRRLRVVRTAFYYPSALILDTLRHAERWCVLDITSSETYAWTKSRGQDARSAVTAMLDQKTEMTIVLPSPGADIIGEPTLRIGRGRVDAAR